MADSTRSAASKARSQFKKLCKCLNHELYAENKKFHLLNTEWTNKRSAFRELVNRGLIQDRCKWVCSACMDFSAKNFCTQRASLSFCIESSDCDAANQDPSSVDLEESKAEVEDGTEHMEVEPPMDAGQVLGGGLIEEVCTRLRGVRWEGLSEQERGELCSLGDILGTIINSALYNDGIAVSGQYKDLENAKNIDPTEWLEQRNALLVAFLSACTGVHVSNSNNNKKINALVHAAEQVLYARNLNLVLPFAFQRNFVSYTQTNSKVVAQLQSGWEPSGSYSTVLSVVKQPTAAPDCPKGDVHVTFDNNQKVGLTSGRIRENSAVPVSICTSVGYISIDPQSDLQEREDLKPEKWLNKAEVPATMDRMNTIEKAYMDEFRRYRGLFINNVIERVSRELELDRESNQLTDYVDIAVSLKERELHTTSIVCCRCTFVFPRVTTCTSGRICPQCGHDAENYPANYDPYYRTDSEHPATTPIMTVGDPCMVNPNGLKNVQKVLDHVSSVSGVAEGLRKWVVVWSDGVPYLFANALQERLYMCEGCGEHFDKSSCSFESHASQCRAKEAATFKMVYGNIILRPGPGHIELNMGKLILSFTWPVFLKVFVQALGFRTPRAQEVVRTGIDHHRTRQIITSTLEAMSAELLVPFVKACKLRNLVPSVESYFEWIEQKVASSVYMYYFNVCFTFLLAFGLYTEATRKNNHSRMMAARVAFAPLFYTRRHPKYQELLLRDMTQRSQYPPDLENHMMETEAFSVSGSQNRGQGADFVHEELNKLIKSFLPPGVPTDETWLRVSRKANVLQDIKRAAMQTASASYEPSTKRPQRHDVEVCMMRRELRSRGCISQPYEPRTMSSLDGTELDYELPQFKELASSNYQTYKDHYAATGCYGPKEMGQICVTKEERAVMESIETKTKAQIRCQTEELISEMPDADIASMHREDMGRELKHMKKAGYVDMYYSVKESLKEQLAAESLRPVDQE